MLDDRVYTVSELNAAARRLLEGEFPSVWVRGEIAEGTLAPSGHFYFTLKDDDCEISAVRFRGRAPLAGAVALVPGTVVLAEGKLTVYEPRGRYQFVASRIQPVGAGALQAAFEELKRRLQAEGLFAPEHKVPLPRFPRRIGVITSPSGAAVRDIVSVLARRWPLAHVLLFPSSVQGETAPGELVGAVDRAVRYARSEGGIDLVIIGRGGGSAEDLAAFNDERLARAVFACPIPVVSAVGHEVDVTILDGVADVRAPTPSAAAELAAPSRDDLAADLVRLAGRMHRTVVAAVRTRAARFSSRLRGYLFRIPQRRIETLEQRLDAAVSDLYRRTGEGLRRRADRRARCADLLRLSDPRRPLERGYSLTFIRGSDRPLRAAADARPGEAIETRLATGRLTSRIEEVTPE